MTLTPATKKKLLDKCPNCKHRFSDWFCWGAYRHCFLCWVDSNYQFTFLEDGRKIFNEKRYACYEKIS